MSQARQQFTNTGQIHQSDANMTDTIPFPCHLSTTGTEKTVNHRPIRQSIALAGIGAGLVVDCQISKVLIPLTLT